MAFATAPAGAYRSTTVWRKSELGHRSPPPLQIEVLVWPDPVVFPCVFGIPVPDDTDGQHILFEDGAELRRPDECCLGQFGAVERHNECHMLTSEAAGK